MKSGKFRRASTSSIVIVIVFVLAAATLASFALATPGMSGKAATTQPLGSLNSVSSSVTEGSLQSNVSSPSELNAQQIYANSDQGVVTVQGSQVQSSLSGSQAVGVLGSGFVVQYLNADYVLTNYHVAGATSNLTVTFHDGDAYPARVVGADPYADLAVISVQQTPASQFHQLTLVSSASLQVGFPIAAIGNPFGLAGSMTIGIVSQLGRTIQDPTAGNFSIANAIQFSAPINPGNSGGPLLNAQGLVVGITTAVISGSQGVGFAIPSDTIIKEMPSLVANGSYNLHSYLGIGGVDMNYQLAQASGTNFTYGVLIENVVQGGPASNAGLRAGNRTETILGRLYFIGGDIIVSINGTRVINNDALATYLEENTIAGQTVSLGIMRDGNYVNINVQLGARPPIS